MSDQFEVVWTGATHRQFPTRPAPSEPRLAYRRSNPQPTDDGLRDVREALSEKWATNREIAEKVSLSDRSTWRWLRMLLNRGEAELMIAPPTSQRGRPQKLYRRRSTPEAAA